MILQSLVQLARNERLIADPDFEFKPISWIVRLNSTGELLGVEENRENLNQGHVDKKGKPLKAKWVGRKRLVPIQFVRTSGDAAFFAVDKADYVFGIAPEKPNRLGLFYAQLQQCSNTLNDTAVTAVTAFGQKLAAMSVEDRSILIPKEAAPGDLFAFRVGEEPELLHECPSIRTYWKLRRNKPDIEEQSNDAARRCLITWQPVSDIPLFRKVKNVPGDASGGLSLVSFNANAWESYGWAKEENAPVSREPAEAVVTALNRLLDPRPLNGAGNPLPVRRIRLGEDTAVIFWSPDPVPEAQSVLDALPSLFDPSDDVAGVGNLFDSLRTGVFKELKSPASFYAMTLTAVTGRIVVRDWFETTVAQVQANLKQHFHDLDCVRNTPPPSGKPLRDYMRLGELLGSLAAPGRENAIPEALASKFVHAALRGTSYPFALLQRSLVRERAEAGGEDWIDAVRRDARAAMLKAVLNRRRRTDETVSKTYSEVQKAMDPLNRNTGYNLGALLAVLERLQTAALKNVNASVVDKYFAGASATPRTTFDRLLRSARHHAKKAQDDQESAGQAYILERLIDELVSRFHAPTAPSSPPAANPARMPQTPAVGLPISLNLEQQALFVIGYHHMRRFLWMSKEERDAWQVEHADAPSAFIRKPSKGSPREAA